MADSACCMQSLLTPSAMLFHSHAGRSSSLARRHCLIWIKGIQFCSVSPCASFERDPLLLLNEIHALHKGFTFNPDYRWNIFHSITEQLNVCNVMLNYFTCFS